MIQAVMILIFGYVIMTDQMLKQDREIEAMPMTEAEKNLEAYIDAAVKEADKIEAELRDDPPFGHDFTNATRYKRFNFDDEFEQMADDLEPYLSEVEIERATEQGSVK